MDCTLFSLGRFIYRLSHFVMMVLFGGNYFLKPNIIELENIRFLVVFLHLCYLHMKVATSVHRLYEKNKKIFFLLEFLHLPPTQDVSVNIKLHEIPILLYFGLFLIQFSLRLTLIKH